MTWFANFDIAKKLYRPSLITIDHYPQYAISKREVDKSTRISSAMSLFASVEITLYVQIHVIRSPAYEYLTRPTLYILTESVVRNFANEDQTITISIPIPDVRATVPTSPPVALGVS